MTTKPQLKLGSHLVPGLAAVALFGVMAIVFLQTSFGDAAGFPEGASITASIGYAMFNLDIAQASGTLVESESFLVAFEIIDIVLVAALAGAVMLARREAVGGFMGDLMADGGRNRDDTEGEH
jgi:NADH-quinone oxidoreductase subunit J